MQKISVEMIVGIHEGILNADGGDQRIISEGNLYQMVFRANQIEDPIDRAALVFWSLCAYPAFREGNRRTAYRTACDLLAAEGYRGDLPCPEMYALTKGIDAFEVDMDDVERTISEIVKMPDRFYEGSVV